MSSDDSNDDAFRIAFRYREVFPEDSTVGHFVVSLSAVMNDLILTHRAWMPNGNLDGDAADNSIFLRRVAAQVWEAHLLISHADEDDEVRAFLDRLPQVHPDGEPFHGDALLRALRGEAGATAPALRQVMRYARNSTHHYPKIGSPGLRAALRVLADEDRTGEVTWTELTPSVRARFAEEVMLVMTMPDDQDQLGDLLEGMVQSVTALIRLAQVAVYLYLAECLGEDPEIERI